MNLSEVANMLKGRVLVIDSISQFDRCVKFSEKRTIVSVFRVHARRASFYYTYPTAGRTCMMELSAEAIEALATKGVWNGRYSKGFDTVIHVQ